MQRLKNHARRPVTKCHDGGIQTGSATDTEDSMEHGEGDGKKLPRGRETAWLKGMSAL